MTAIKYLINQIGFAVCHQIAERSISIGEATLPVCARDTGIYIGFLVSFIYLLIVEKRRPNWFPPIPVVVVGLLCLSVMILDGFTSYLGLRATTNWIRLLTGTGTGAFLAILLLPLFNYQIWVDSSSEKVLKQPMKQIGLLVTLGLILVLFKAAPSLLSDFFFYLTGVGIVGTFFVVNLIIVCLLPFWHRKIASLKVLVFPLLAALALCGIEFYWAHLFHRWLLGV